MYTWYIFSPVIHCSCTVGESQTAILGFSN